MKQAFRYGSAQSQAGDLHRPDAGDRWPVVCLLHGGFWRTPHGREQMDGVAEELAARGYAVWNIGYRRIGEPGGGWPGTLGDVAAAIDHLVVLAADDPRLDLRRVALVGHSAGGQLALCAGARGRVSRRFAPAHVVPKAVCALAAIADLEHAYELGSGRGAVAALLDGSPDKHAGRYAQASPLRLLPLGVRQLILHGTDDAAVPPAMSDAYARAARAAGDRVDHVEFQRTGHMEYLDPTSEVHSRLCQWLGVVLGSETPEARG